MPRLWRHSPLVRLSQSAPSAQPGAADGRKRLPLHLVARWTVEGMRSTTSPRTADSRRRRISSSAAIWMLDPSALAPAKVSQTLLLLVRRLGAYDVTTPRGRGSEEFGPLETIPHQQGTDPPSSPRKAQPRHDATQIPLVGTWSRTIARVGLMRSPALADAGLRP
jgi:hypothetical protein